MTPSMRLGLGLVSAATLAFEINLTRLFSVAQFYHFAFLIVSLALLGFGASGTTLALFPRLGRRHPPHALGALSAACAVSLLGAYLATNWLPFDSFSIAWDARQLARLALHFVVLATPFFFAGMAVGLLLSVYPREAGSTYAVNLAGSACGCVLALAAPSLLGGEGTVALSASLAALAALLILGTSWRVRELRPALVRLSALGVLLFGLVDSGLRLTGRAPWRVMELHLSPYKGLSYALQYPGAEVVYRRWNASSRVDVVRSGGVRSLPGLSYLSPHAPPPQDGLLVDGDDLSPVVLPGADLAFADYMPAAIAFRLRPAARTLILDSRAGLDVLIALALGARQVTAVEVNPLVVAAARSAYADPRVLTVVEAPRSYLGHSPETFEVVVLALSTSYHPIRSGAYSLAEDYGHTVEAYAAALERLSPRGLLVITRWLQFPPSEELRAFATAVTALERLGGDPRTQIVGFRGFNIATLLIQRRPFEAAEVEAVRAFASSRAFDLVFAPDLRPDETNQHNVLPEPIYFQTFSALASAPDREAWYRAYPFAVSPPTDDRPFFGQFFKWAQAPQIVAEFGKSWQPFGGAGYFVLLTLLALAGATAFALILLPLGAARLGSAHTPASSVPRGAALSALAYFGLIGLGFLLIEIPLVQHFILFLGQPAYALTAVLFALLLFSGIGSQLAHRVPHRPALGLVVLLALSMPWLLPRLFALTLGLPLTWRLVEAIFILAPLGLVMGVAFPRGIQRLEREAPQLIPWAWGVNGAASVVSSVLAALLALSFGFSWVLGIGAVCYGGAWLTAGWWADSRRRPRP